jgi:peroxiredoxin
MIIAALLSLFFAQDLGPAVGSTVPEADRFEAAMGEKGATIVFVRSVDWCPFCKQQVQELSSQKAAFEKEGQPLIFVSYDSPAVQAEFQKRGGFEANFVSDEGSKLIEAFGLLNEAHRPGSRAYGIPHPAVIIVDENGVVERKLYEEDYASNATSYRNRPAVETILEAVRAE